MPRLLENGQATSRFWLPTAAASLLMFSAALIFSWGSWPASAALVLFAAASPVLAAIDWRERRLPDLVTLPLAAACSLALLVAALWGDDWSRFGVAVACSAGATAFFFVLFAVAPSQLGFGDVKLMLSAGLVLGWHGPVVTIVGVTLGLVIGLVFGVVLIILGRAHRRSHVALGPHLIAGSLILGFLMY